MLTRGLRWGVVSSRTCPVADWQKTEAQKVQEALLLDELVEIVDKRDELVQDLDCQERGYVCLLARAAAEPQSRGAAEPRSPYTHRAAQAQSCRATLSPSRPQSRVEPQSPYTHRATEPTHSQSRRANAPTELQSPYTHAAAEPQSQHSHRAAQPQSQRTHRAAEPTHPQSCRATEHRAHRATHSKSSPTPTQPSAGVV